MILSIESTLGLILASEEAKAILEKHIPDTLSNPQIGQAMVMSLKAIASAPSGTITEEQLAAIAADLDVAQIAAVTKFKVGDRARVQDRPGWPGGYKIANWEGEIVEVKEDPFGYVIMKADKTGYNMAFPEIELDKV